MDKSNARVILSFAINAVVTKDKTKKTALETRECPIPCQLTKEENKAFQSSEWKALRHKLTNHQGSLISLEKLKKMEALWS